MISTRTRSVVPRCSWYEVSDGGGPSMGHADLLYHPQVRAADRRGPRREQRGRADEAGITGVHGVDWQERLGRVRRCAAALVQPAPQSQHGGASVQPPESQLRPPRLRGCGRAYHLRVISVQTESLT
jgi:hypothetical protein